MNKHSTVLHKDILRDSFVFSPPPLPHSLHIVLKNKSYCSHAKTDVELHYYYDWVIIRCQLKEIIIAEFFFVNQTQEQNQS